MTGHGLSSESEMHAAAGEKAATALRHNIRFRATTYAAETREWARKDTDRSNSPSGRGNEESLGTWHGEKIAE